LSVAIERSSRLCSLSAEKEKERESILRATGEAPKTLRKIVCRKNGRALLVPAEQILWFQVQDGIVHATTVKDSFWVNYQLSELEAALPPDEFFRARREVLVNMSRIKEIRPYFKSSFLLVMSDAASTEIAVSERQARPLRQRLPGL
jgi:DNA-binding LytR/AlgR family response regulator